MFFLLNKIRQHVAENRNEPVSKMAASFGRKTMLLPQVLRSVLKIFISKIDRKYAENMRYPCPRFGLPKFILWAIFKAEFRRPNQCLVAFGDYATGRFQHCYTKTFFPKRYILNTTTLYKVKNSDFIRRPRNNSSSISF